jgi:hypothetical protein
MKGKRETCPVCSRKSTFNQAHQNIALETMIPIISELVTSLETDLRMPIKVEKQHLNTAVETYESKEEVRDTVAFGVGQLVCVAPRLWPGNG